MIDVETLRKLLRYEPETGKLFRKPRPQSDFPDLATYRRWVARYCDKEALYAKHPKGYLSGTIDGHQLLAHRAAWAIHYGFWPDHIDHVNGDRADTRIVNLRECTLTENQGNAKARDGISGLKGVYLRKRDGKWVAAITRGGRYSHIGVFSDKNEAASAYNDAAQVYFGKFARLNPV